MSKNIFIAASPNTQSDDVWLAFKLLWQPWKWFSKEPVSRFEKQVSTYFDGREAVAMDSARSSLYEILKAYNIGASDEVILPALTCLVVANPILWNGAKPIYVDSDPKTFNYDHADLQKKITANTKAIIVQHTFGIPEDVDAIKKMVGDKVLIIEDLAHALGGTTNGKKLGTLGDAAILTFGIEKVISSVRGGMAVLSDPKIAEKIRADQQKLPKFSFWRVYVSLKNPLFWWFLTPIYYWGVSKLTFGRVIAFFAHLFGFLGNMIEGEEYLTKKPKWLPAQLPGALAELGMHQFAKLEVYTLHRLENSRIYRAELGGVEADVPLLRFPVLIENRQKLFEKAKRNHVILGDWYKRILYAPESSLQALGYAPGSCPNAEKIAAEIVNLPTAINVSPEDAKRIAEFVKIIK